MTALDATHDAYLSLRAHLREQLPDADIRSYRISTYCLKIHVGPEVGLSTDYEVRPELFRVACAIDPFIDPESAFSSIPRGSWWAYQWTCSWAGVRVVVTGEGKGEPVAAPKPLPEPRVVAA